jgi:imidazolonepropionase-like amidohydrolase
MSKQHLHIRNARLIDPHNGVDDLLDLFIAEGRIAAIGEPPAGFSPARSINALGLIACPGLVDLSARLGGIEAELGAAVAGRGDLAGLPTRHQAPARRTGGSSSASSGEARQRGWRGSIRSERSPKIWPACGSRK